ncbi:MAG: hypothetical protein US23_C0015G0001 [candidate division WS6 bacterium GW2011_GWE1_36_69]|nr:MAG: hypothetical protein US23_C0015G0001 [candidate division WS6 bacterium GW2011_GWE1_36_69]
MVEEASVEVVEVLVVVEEALVVEEEVIDQKCLMQYVINVVRTVESHSDHQETNLSTVVIVLNQRETKVEEMKEVEDLRVEIENQVLIEVDSETEKRNRCLKQYVMNVDKHVKFHSNHLATNQSIVVNVSNRGGCNCDCKADIEALNKKLDKIISILEPIKEVKATKKAIEKEVAEVVKEVKKTAKKVVKKAKEIKEDITE